MLHLCIFKYLIRTGCKLYAVFFNRGNEHLKLAFDFLKLLSDHIVLVEQFSQKSVNLGNFRFVLCFYISYTLVEALFAFLDILGILSYFLFKLPKPFVIVLDKLLFSLFVLLFISFKLIKLLSVLSKYIVDALIRTVAYKNKDSFDKHYLVWIASRRFDLFGVLSLKIGNILINSGCFAFYVGKSLLVIRLKLFHLSLIISILSIK